MSSLLCAGCGAPLPEDAARAVTTCAFCGTASTPAPRVVERTVERIVVVAAPGATPGGLSCPRCAVPLAEARVNQTLLRGCERCGGIWLEPDAVERLRDARDTEVEDTARRLVGLVL